MTFFLKCEGPIYRPPSEAGSLLIQATMGCPHNKCTFCMVYKKGPPFRVRPVAEITTEMENVNSGPVVIGGYCFSRCSRWARTSLISP